MYKCFILEVIQIHLLKNNNQIISFIMKLSISFNTLQILREILLALNG